MAELFKSAETVQEAVALALEELGKTEDQVSIEVIQKEKKGFMGFGGSQAEIKVVFEEAAVGNTVETDNQKVAYAVSYLQDILNHMDLADTEIEVKETQEHAILDLKGPNVGAIIGRRGETLDALQYLTSLVANRVDDTYYKITLDSNNYRDKRESTLQGLAKKIAKTAVRTGRSTALEPMNPYERRIIHTAVGEVEGAVSKSSGEEPYRKVVISSANPRRPFNKDRRNNFNKDNRGHGGNRDNRRFNDKKRESNEETLRQVKTGVDDIVKSRIFDKIGENDDTPLYSKIDLDEE